MFHKTNRWSTLHFPLHIVKLKIKMCIISTETKNKNVQVFAEDNDDYANEAIEKRGRGKMTI